LKGEKILQLLKNKDVKRLKKRSWKLEKIRNNAGLSIGADLSPLSIYSTTPPALAKT